MRKQFQDSWHGIKFETFSTSTKIDVPNNDFYEKFYQEFFKRYSSFDSLPDSYLEKKKDTVRVIRELLNDKEHVLSIGCGLGIIEYLLLRNEPLETRLTGIEPSKNALKWIEEEELFPVINGYFPTALSETICNFDFAYARAMEYHFTDTEYVDFLTSIRHFGIPEFAIISASPDRNNLEFLFKYYVKKALASVGVLNLGQFWGYLRTPDEHVRAFEKAGFHHILTKQIDYSTLLIVGKSDA